MSIREKSDEEKIAEHILNELAHRAVLDLMFDAVEHYASPYLTSAKFSGDLPVEVSRAVEKRDLASLKKYNPGWLDERDEMAYQAEEHNQPESVRQEYEILSVIAQMLDYICSEPTTPFQLAGFVELLESFDTQPYAILKSLVATRKSQQSSQR